MRLPWFSRKQGEKEIARLEEKIDGLIHEMKNISISVGRLKEDVDGKFEEMDQEFRSINDSLRTLYKNDEDFMLQKDELMGQVEKMVEGATGSVEQMKTEWSGRFQELGAEMASLKEGMGSLSKKDGVLSRTDAEIIKRMGEGMKGTRHSLNRLFKGLNVVYKAGNKLEENMEGFKERFSELDEAVRALKAELREVKKAKDLRSLSGEDSRQEVLEWLQKDPSLTENDLALLLGRKKDSVVSDIESLKRDGYLEVYQKPKLETGK